MDTFNVEEIKILFKRCNKCNGAGATYEDAGHDCWGKPETNRITCYTCSGYGFSIRPDFVRTIKETICR